MSKPNDRIVYKRPEDGKWVNKKVSSDKATSLHDRQIDAEAAAKENLKNQGGGELTLQGRNGKIRSKDTIAPGNDPCPPKDKEN